ncbi:MAG TPA: LLM class flavin-dependent oxidoreductase, partial [Microlunatus sp.]|nr:LLM class flavin-dependent oxidoreductase [Microlunatus sp.]
MTSSDGRAPRPALSDTSTLRLGITYVPYLHPEHLRDLAQAAQECGLDDLWVWEDCFKQSGVAAAAAALAWTDTVRVGIGLLPVPLRNVALTAMEIATLSRLFPGRLLPGIGHGVQPWMA